MATTLRINEALFREVKAEAARLGLTLTRFTPESEWIDFVASTAQRD